MALSFAVLAATLAAVACSPHATVQEPQAATAPTDPEAKPLALCPGTFNVLPARALGLATAQQASAATWDDGSPLKAVLFIPTITLYASPFSAWVPALGPVSAPPPPSTAALPPDTLLLLLAPERPTSKAIRASGRVFATVWLAAPASSTSHPAPLASDLTARPQIAAALNALAADPLSRWHARLLRGTLWNASGESASDRFTDPTLEGWALAVEARWRTALDLLSATSPYSCELLSKRLAAVARFRSGAHEVLAPAWPSDAASLARLLDQLTDPAAGSDLPRSADLWRDEQPHAITHVLRDRLPAAGDRPISLLSVANLSSSAVITWASPEGSGELDRSIQPVVELPPMTADTLQAVGPLPPFPPLSTLRIRIGPEERRADVHLPIIPADPPAVPLSPLLAQWTLDRWLAPVDASVPNGGVCVTLTRQADAKNVGEGWFAFVQVAEESLDTDPASPSFESLVRVWLDDGQRAITIRPAAESITEDRLKPDQTLAPVRPVASAVFRRTGKGWSAQVRLPLSVNQRELLIAVERIDRAGARSTWPHEVFPWQPAPDPAILDLNAWDHPRPAQ